MDLLYRDECIEHLVNLTACFFVGGVGYLVFRYVDIILVVFLFNVFCCGVRPRCDLQFPHHCVRQERRTVANSLATVAGTQDEGQER